MSSSQPVDLRQALSRLDAPWTPKIVAELNGQEVRLARLEGAFEWHRHSDADELFLVLSGRLRMELRDGDVELSEGQLFVVPRGVEHRPVALEVAEVLLLDPAGTRNTGDHVSARTVEAEHLEPDA